ncbi:methyltransferase [Streptomyces sp. NPDC059928]|uniref:methyltransferase n=1 Tax=unclassified Streptomyces TaxID=2593676 RepID=UPI00365F3D68
MKISDAVLDVLSRAHTDGSHLTLFEQLDRSEYLAVDKVLKAAGGTWNRSAGAHLFPTSAADAVEALLLTGEVCRPQDFGYFPTPAPVVEELLSLADLRTGDEVLEPSAGRGAIAAEAARTCPVDCIELLAEQRYDRVVMNPPFARQADIDHVTHALSFLRPHGRLTTVMSSALTFRTNARTANFRALIKRSGGSASPLPDGAFKPSGTAVRAVLVTLPAL